MKECLEKLIGKKVKLTCLFSGNVIFYNGVILKVGDNFVEIKDKFNNTVIVSLDVIKKVDVCG